MIFAIINTEFIYSLKMDSDGKQSNFVPEFRTITNEIGVHGENSLEGFQMNVHLINWNLTVNFIKNFDNLPLIRREDLNCFWLIIINICTGILVPWKNKERKN